MAKYNALGMFCHRCIFSQYPGFLDGEQIIVDNIHVVSFPLALQLRRSEEHWTY